jgi:SAM-dependent methyltransferase
MFMKRGNPHALALAMIGIKMGDRFLQVGCANGERLAAVAAKVGLSGRAVVAAPDESSAARARSGAAAEGVLVEIEIAPPIRLPFDDRAFDIAVVDDTGDLLGTMAEADRGAAIRELRRVLRPGGRAMIVGAIPRGGLGSLLSRARSGPSFTATGGATAALDAEGFKSVRTLGEREGLVFIEAINPRGPAGQTA